MGPTAGLDVMTKRTVSASVGNRTPIIRPLAHSRLFYLLNQQYNAYRACIDCPALRLCQRSCSTTEALLLYVNEFVTKRSGIASHVLHSQRSLHPRYLSNVVSACDDCYHLVRNPLYTKLTVFTTAIFV
jgi:hypothetical protein